MRKVYSSNLCAKLCILACAFLLNLMPVMAKSDFITIGGFKYYYDTETQEASVCENGLGKYSGDVTIPSTIDVEGVECKVVELKPMLFFMCSDLKSVQLPASLKKIGNWCFNTCRKLESVEIPSSVEEIGSSSFLDCNSLKTIDLSACNLEVIDDEMFKNCTSLNEVRLPNSLQSIGKQAFSGCTSLSKILVPENVSSLGNNCFDGCTSLSVVQLSSSLKAISSYCFYGCSSLTEISIPASVQAIGSWAFDGAGLKTLQLPEGLSVIGSYSFVYNKSLEKVVLPSTLETMGTGSFDDCDALTEFVCLAVTPPDLQGIMAFLPMFSHVSSDCTLYVPEESVQKYKDDKNWGVFYQIEAYKGATGIDDVTYGKATITSNDGCISIDGLSSGARVEAYSVSGNRLAVAQADNGTVSMKVGSGVVIVKIGKQAVKLVVK